MPCCYSTLSLPSPSPFSPPGPPSLHLCQLYFTQVEFFAAVFLIVSLALSLAVITFLRFRLRRPYGIFLIIFYIVFLVVAIIAETQVFTINISGVLSKQ